MRLFIAEKPNVAKAIAAELGVTTRGDGYFQCGQDRVTWLVGHMLKMAMPEHYGARTPWRVDDLPIIPNEWVLLPVERTESQLLKVGKLLKEATSVVHAGDPDREGQLLVNEVLEHFRSQLPIKRFWATSQTSTSVSRALAALKDNDQYQSSAEAALARQRADWLVGINCSRAYTLRAQRAGAQNTTLAVGRVQTPTLSMVVARDREIENFTPATYFKIYADIQHPNGSFRAAWEPNPKQTGLDAERRLIDSKIAANIVSETNGATGFVTEYTVEPKLEHHPHAFSLTDISLIASNKFGYSAEKTLEICQSLYDIHKLTSYPRVDTGYLPELQFDDAPAIMAALAQGNPHLADLIKGTNLSLKSKTWDDSKVTAHHGIVPTDQVANLSALNEAERNLYDLIVLRYIAQFYPVHQYLQTTVKARFALEYFGATGRTVTDPGWKAVYAAMPDDSEAKDESQTVDQVLPKMAQADVVKCSRAESKSLKTKPPARFTEGTLQQAMENIHRYVTDLEQKKSLREGEGIGTPATRPSILAELRRHGFLEAKGKFIISTPLGRGLIDTLPDALKNPSLTALYERLLKDIEKGKATVNDFVTAQIAFVQQHVAEANASSAAIAGTLGPECPVCKTGNLRRIPRKDKGHFWGCSRYAEGCKAGFDDIKGKPDLAPKAATPAGPTIQCPTCKTGNLRCIKGPKGVFWGCTRYSEGCKASFNDDGGKPNLAPRPPATAAGPTIPCPTCKTGAIRRIDGPKGVFWGCNRFRDGCKATFKDMDGKPALPAS